MGGLASAGPSSFFPENFLSSRAFFQSRAIRPARAPAGIPILAGIVGCAGPRVKKRSRAPQIGTLQDPSLADRLIRPGVGSFASSPLYGPPASRLSEG